MKKGKLWVIEGTDCSGKETQAKLLLERLAQENILVETMSFPRYDTPTGRIIGQSYLGKKDLGQGDVLWFGKPDLVDPKIASLYFAADRLAAVPKIEKIINSGTNLILDRFVESNKAHQGGKIIDPVQRKEMFEFIDKLEYGLLEIPRPDKVIFLYMPRGVAKILTANRKEAADGHEDDEIHLMHAEQTYLQLAKEYGWTKIDCAPDGTINSLRTPKEIHEEVYNSLVK